MCRIPCLHRTQLLCRAVPQQFMVLFTCCVFCIILNVEARYSCSRPIHTWRHCHAWWRECLKLGAEATIIVTTQSHTFLVLHEWDWLASVLGYFHKAIWLADACVGAWKVWQFSSAMLDITPFKVIERRWRSDAVTRCSFFPGAFAPHRDKII